MTRLALGIALWSFTHFVPAVFTGLRSRLVARLGEMPYKGVFTLLMALALYLVITGWKAAIPQNVYLPPIWGRHLTALLVLVGFILFIAPYLGNNIRRWLRHPQLTGVACWGVGHLLANGEGRSILLFGGLAAWAIIEMMMLNRRDGAWVKPATAPRRNDLIIVVVGVVAYVILAASHQWLFGFSPFLR